MIHFHLKPHDLRRNTDVIEILDEQNQLLGCIYAQQWGIRLLSKHLDPTKVHLDLERPLAVEIQLP